MRTANVDTPAAAAIAAWDFPAAASSPILPVSSGVSLDGPFGPRLPAASPASPPRRYPSSHRHSVTMPIPNASAICCCVAAFSSASCTAASRRPASSPPSQQNVIRPCTHTAPPPSGSDSSPTPRATSAAPSGIHGSGSCDSMPAISASRNRPTVLRK